VRDTLQLFFAVLTLAALAGAVGIVIARLLARRSTAAASVVDAFSGIALPLAWVVALTATLGSLYFSEIEHFEPCKLCWFQRVFMYPLAIILGIAMARRDRKIWLYAVPLAAVGAAVSVYHYLVERYPSLDGGTCSAAVPCTFIWFEEFGFVTLPFMALSGFLFIIALLTLPAPQEA
jgi:disulfide bond formation protein DsbB